MNRSILIVICDFLLVSLLAFTSADINKVTNEGAPAQMRIEVATNQQPASGSDLSAVMRLALNEERKNRDLLMGELARSRETSSRQQSLLGDREKQAQALQQELALREQQTAELQQRQTNLMQQVASAQASIQNLNEQLQASTSQQNTGKEKIAALQKELDSLQRSNQLALAEQQRLAGQLQVAEVERRHATQQVAQMQQEVKIEREEKARLTQQATTLAQGVQALATNSSELAREVRENRPLAANTIFNIFATNRVDANLDASRPGLLGTNKRRETQTVLVTDGTNTVALCHVQETPLTFFVPGIDWQNLEGALTRGNVTVPVRSLSFSAQDPRVVYIPVAAEEARRLGAKVYRFSADPYKFQDAVLVGAKEGYYGECRFQIELGTPDYVKLDNNFIKGLFGKFNPSRGDLVFSKTGELMGVMANSTYCLMLRSFDATARIQFGPQTGGLGTGVVLARLYQAVQDMPAKLQ